jgi:hypothetical protein
MSDSKKPQREIWGFSIELADQKGNQHVVQRFPSVYSPKKQEKFKRVA